jgi:hypothetical protein
MQCLFGRLLYLVSGDWLRFQFDVEEPVSELPKRRHTSKADTGAITLTILDREVKEIAAKFAMKINLNAFDTIQLDQLRTRQATDGL